MLTEYKSTKFEDLLADAQEKGGEAVELLVEMATKKAPKEFTNKKGKTVTKDAPVYSFLEVKKAYFEKYYPDLVPKSKKEKSDPMLVALKKAGLVK